MERNAITLGTAFPATALVRIGMSFRGLAFVHAS